jgi:hypothetical protein
MAISQKTTLFCAYPVASGIPWDGYFSKSLPNHHSDNQHRQSIPQKYKNRPGYQTTKASLVGLALPDEKRVVNK